MAAFQKILDKEKKANLEAGNLAHQQLDQVIERLSRVLDAMGDPTLGIITTHHYSYAHESPQNEAFRKAYASVAGANERANFMAVGGYDGMAAIAETVKKLGGKMDADKAMEILKSYKAESPRGPIEIDPQTRDIIQSVYVRKVEKKSGHFVNVEFDRFPHFKDPGKEATKEAAR